MCTYYEVPGREQLVMHFADVPEQEWRDKMSPLYRGPFLRAKGEAERKLVVGQWGLMSTFPSLESRCDMYEAKSA